jgi:hypothetical protein
LWDESISSQVLVATKRASWILHVFEFGVVLTGGQKLPPGRQQRCKCILTFKLNTNGVWSADELTPKLITVNPTGGGLGCVGHSTPSSENIFVVMNPNNFSLAPPELQAQWWSPKFGEFLIPNSLVLGISDRYNSNHDHMRCLTTWTRRVTAPAWICLGKSHIFLNRDVSNNDRIESAPPRSLPVIPQVPYKAGPVSPPQCQVPPPRLSGYRRPAPPPNATPTPMLKRSRLLEFETVFVPLEGRGTSDDK